MADQLRRLPLRSANADIDWALDQLDRYPGALRVGELAAEVQLSRRRFIELFRREVGTTPKQFIRLRRFQSAVAQMKRDPAIKGSTLAAACGYADQAHLIREFRDLSGSTPSALLGA